MIGAMVAVEASNIAEGIKLMRNNHTYVDLSDLNARYDQMAVQGLGGGSLGSSSSLGTTAPSLPWMQYSADTAGLQTRTNISLAANGYDLIAVDGILGPFTCGAVRAVLPGEVPATCREFKEPRVADQLQEYPWMQYSAATAALQTKANAELVGQGYAPITVDGILGPVTCGALQAVLPEEAPYTCRAYQAPVIAAQTQQYPVKVPAVTTQTVVPKTNGIAPTQAATGSASIPWGWMVGSVALLGITVWAIQKD